MLYASLFLESLALVYKEGNLYYINNFWIRLFPGRLWRSKSSRSLKMIPLSKKSRSEKFGCLRLDRFSVWNKIYNVNQRDSLMRIIVNQCQIQSSSTYNGYNKFLTVTSKKSSNMSVINLLQKYSFLQLSLILSVWRFRHWFISISGHCKSMNQLRKRCNCFYIYPYYLRTANMIQIIPKILHF